MPEESLLLEKATGAVPHTGGKRFEPNSEYYQTLLGWLEAGAPDDAGEVPTVESVELYPPQAVLEGEGAKQQMIVRAKYSDGTRPRRDRPGRVPVEQRQLGRRSIPTALVTAANRGEAFVMARFETKTVGSQVLVLPAGLDLHPADRRRRPTTSTNWSTPSSHEAADRAQRDLHATRSSSAA